MVRNDFSKNNHLLVSDRWPDTSLTTDSTSTLNHCSFFIYNLLVTVWSLTKIDLIKDLGFRLDQMLLNQPYMYGL